MWWDGEGGIQVGEASLEEKGFEGSQREVLGEFSLLYDHGYCRTQPGGLLEMERGKLQHAGHYAHCADRRRGYPANGDSLFKAHSFNKAESQRNFNLFSKHLFHRAFVMQGNTTNICFPFYPIRTIQAPAQVPVVVSPGNQQLHTVTLQTVPLTTVIASGDPTSATSQKFILQAIPTSQPMTVLKENVLLQAPKPVSPPSSIVLSPAQVHQVLTSNVQTICNGTVNVDSSPSFSTATPIVTFTPSNSQLVAQPSNTVITSVIKAPETKPTVIQGIIKEEAEDSIAEDPKHSEQSFQQQPFVVVVSSSNGFPSAVHVKQEREPLEPSPNE